MAERRIHTIFVWKDAKVGSGSAGGTASSDPIELRDIAITGDLSVSYKITTSGAASTCASTKIIVSGGANSDSNFLSPTGGTCATHGNAGGEGFVSLSSLPAMPWIRVDVIAGSSGTALIDFLEIHAR